MIHKILYALLLAWWLQPAALFAQFAGQAAAPESAGASVPPEYRGGAGRGDIRRGTAPSILGLTNVGYTGGAGRGDQVAGAVVSSLGAPIGFVGGSGRGDAFGSAEIGIVGLSIYSGGSGRGDIRKGSAPSILGLTNVGYTGGAGRGDYMAGATVSSLGSPIGFIGGSGRGDAFGGTEIGIVGLSIYSGGSGRGDVRSRSAPTVILGSCAVTIQPTVTVFPTYGLSDGVAQADYTGGAAPVAINWSNGAVGATLSGVPPGAYTITLTDANGCSASATVELPPVARGAVHWSADPDQGVKDVTVRQTGSVAGVRITGADGLYRFDPTSTSALLTLTPEKTAGKLLGVTAADATRIRRHVVLLDTLEAPYQLIAGDVSGNNQISSLDAVLIIQCLLGNPAACNQWIASWRFVDAAHAFPNPLTPWGFPERIQLSPGVQRTGSGLDFTGIKVGDVVISNQIPQLRLQPLVLRGADVQLRAGEQIETDIQVYGYEDVTAFQLALDYDPALLQLEAVETPAGGLLESGDFSPWTASPGSLRAARVDLQGVSLENGAPFFTLRFRAQESGAWLSDALAIDTTALQAEAYKSDLTPQPVLLELQGASSAEDITSGRLSLRVQPNPAKASAALWFTLPEASEAHIRVLDATGRIIQAHRGWYVAGTYERRLDFPSAGLYVVQVATQQGMESVRVIAAGR